MAEEKKKGADPAAAQAKKAKPAGNPPKGAPAGKGAGGKGKGDKDAKADAKPHVEIKRTAPPRLKELYNKEILPKLMKEFNYTNPQQAPRLVKITLNMGLGEAIGNPKIVIGVSGGLDSTLALLVIAHAFDTLGLDRAGIVAVTKSNGSGVSALSNISNFKP